MPQLSIDMNLFEEKRWRRQTLWKRYIKEQTRTYDEWGFKRVQRLRQRQDNDEWEKENQIAMAYGPWDDATTVMAKRWPRIKWQRLRMIRWLKRLNVFLWWRMTKDQHRRNKMKKWRDNDGQVMARIPMAWNSQLTLTNVSNKDMSQKEHNVIVSDGTHLYHTAGYLMGTWAWGHNPGSLMANVQPQHEKTIQTAGPNGTSTCSGHS